MKNKGLILLLICSLGISWMSCDNSEEMLTGPDFQHEGVHPVGTTLRYITDSERTEYFEPKGLKIVPVQIWYPATAETAGLQKLLFLDFFPEEYKDQSIEDMLLSWSDSTDMPPGLDTLETNSVKDAELNTIDGPYPLILFSHGHTEMRFSWFTMAEYLASHGYIVVGIDHVGNACASSTPGIYYECDEASLLYLDYYYHRLEDVTSVLDGLEIINQTADDPFYGMINVQNAGMFGHSFGALTTAGSVIQEPRLKCGMPVAAALHPLDDNPPLGISKPMMFMIADYENATTLMGGNKIVRDCYDAAVGDKYYLTSLNSGHFTYTNICYVDPDHGEGCGSGENGEGEWMTYVDQDLVNPVFNAYAAAFFGLYLKKYGNYRSFLKTNNYPDLIEYEYDLR